MSKTFFEKPDYEVQCEDCGWYGFTQNLLPIKARSEIYNKCPECKSTCICDYEE